jgi:hypothetical protein
MKNTTPMKIVQIFYKAILPLVSIFVLFYLSGIAPRNWFFHSKSIDYFVRFIICFFLCYGYFNMPFISHDFKTYEFPSFKKKELVVYPGKLLLSLGMILARFIVIFLFTFLIIEIFVPILKEIEALVSIINGLFFAIPAVAQYKSISKENRIINNKR